MVWHKGSYSTWSFQCGFLNLLSTRYGVFLILLNSVSKLLFQPPILLHPGKLTWQWKNNHLKMWFLLYIVIFHCHVSFLWCISFDLLRLQMKLKSPEVFSQTPQILMVNNTVLWSLPLSLSCWPFRTRAIFDAGAFQKLMVPFKLSR